MTAIVKLFLKKPNETQELVQTVLSLATQDSDNPDLRDRGYIYWRLLSTDPAAAKEVVLAEKPLISEETDLLEPTLLDELICHIGSLASVIASFIIRANFLHNCIFQKVYIELGNRHLPVGALAYMQGKGPSSYLAKKAALQPVCMLQLLVNKMR